MNYEHLIDHPDYETCSWCTTVRPFRELERNEQPDGALVCTLCARAA